MCITETGKYEGDTVGTEKIPIKLYNCSAQHEGGEQNVRMRLSTT